MVTRGEMSYLRDIVAIIREAKQISTIQLVIRSRKSLSYFEKMRRFIPELYHDIQYNRETKFWEAIETQEM